MLRARPSARFFNALVLIGAMMTIGALAGIAAQYASVSDSLRATRPPDRPLRVVDASLLATLRAQPGLHRPLAADFRFAPGVEAALHLEDDALNRWVYGTDIDRREMSRKHAALHIQFKNGRGAIHCDGTNPKLGLGAWLAHATFDVPFTPLCAVLLIGLLLVRRGRRGRASITR